MKASETTSLSGRTARPLDVTRLGLGGAPLGNLHRRISEEDAQATLDAAFESGIKLFDTAPLTLELRDYQETAITELRSRWAQGQRRQGGVGGAKRNVAEHVQDRELLVKGVQQVIDQGRFPFSRSAAMRSIPIPRDPLMRRKSPLQMKPDK